MLMKKETVGVFVYGTLKLGGYFAGYLDKYRQICEKAILPKAKIYDLGSFPAVATTGDEKDEVIGEYHEYSDPSDVLKLLDQIEGYHGPSNPTNLYDRVKASVRTETGEKEAYIYVYADDLSDKVPIKDCQWEV